MKRSELVRALTDAAPARFDPEVVLDIERHALGTVDRVQRGTDQSDAPAGCIVLRGSERG